MNKKLNVLIVIALICSTSYSVAESAFGNPISTSNYEISREKIERVIREGDIIPDLLEIKNFQNIPITILFTTSGDATSMISNKESQLVVEPKDSSEWFFNIIATTIGNFEGELTLSGDISEVIPINITVVNASLYPAYLLELNMLKQEFTLNEEIAFKVDITKLNTENTSNISIMYNLINDQNQTIPLDQELIILENTLHFIKEFSFPKDLPEGYYQLEVQATHKNETVTSESLFLAKIPFLSRKLFGSIPMWLLLTGILVILFAAVSFYLIRRHIENKKKYKMSLDMKSIPKKDKSFLWLGRVAEKKEMAYLDPNRLTTHAIVAGATGGGKSIAAQVLIEEALKQNVCVIVFDPTAQWSGMLRKLEDKKMFSFYPKFGMKPSDARGFPGNIRAVKDARQIIEVEKYFEPGHIQIFTLNKLQPKDMDIFIANIVRQIFKSDPKEYPTLRTLLVFDEIHRILPKFGGSGEGFIQIERACREFRKWGYGVALISQVLSDFAGQIKANISTEVQMRTRDEGDLNRIKTKYGDQFLQSLVKASVGVGMFVNPAYNHANPYFINFRPILHNTRRLSDEELEKYNQYNDVVEDLEYQIEQLEELKVDVFDLKMELKLVKDKIMTGNFSVVDIYLEGLKPRITKQWEKIGKKPKKKEIELADIKEIKKSVEEAKAEGKKAREKEAAAEEAAAEAAKDPMEELNNKIVNPLTLDNGIMISSLKELKSTLPNLDAEIFKLHVNKEKNDIATWFEQLSKVYGARLKSITDKEELLKEIEAFKGEKEPSAPEKKDDNPKDKEGKAEVVKKDKKVVKKKTLKKTKKKETTDETKPPVEETKDGKESKEEGS